MGKARGWFFTLNNYVEGDCEKLAQLFQGFGAKYVFQEEVGESGTPHLQGVVYFKNARQLAGLKSIDGRAHWEICRNWKASTAYCTKERSRAGGIYQNLHKVLRDPMVGLTANGMQAEVLRLIAEAPDDRRINWVYDPEGCQGKTTLAKHLCVTRNDVLYLSGSAKDCKYAVQQFITKAKLHACIFGFTRTVEEYVSYEALESIKDGIFFSGKYEAGMVVFDCPHVIVMANFAPKKEMLTEDRWNIITVGS